MCDDLNPDMVQEPQLVARDEADSVAKILDILPAELAGVVIIVLTDQEGHICVEVRRQMRDEYEQANLVIGLMRAATKLLQETVGEE